MTTAREETLRYLKARRDEHMEQAERHYKAIEPLNAVIEEIEKEIVAQVVSPSVAVPGPALAEFPIGKLRSMTQLQAVIAIAKHLGGTVRAQDAKHLMIRAGVMRETKNSTNITHNIIIRSGKFYRIAPGEYRLKEPKSTEGAGTVFETPMPPVQ
jgi:hypothetical protein